MVMKKLLMTCVAAVALLLPVAAQARPPVGPYFGGGVAILPAPVFFGGFYGPSFWGPYGFYGPYYYGPASGAVKFDTSVKDAKVFVNGAYAGTVRKVKTLHLRPGTYNIELKGPGGTYYGERIFVLTGKTLRLHPDLRAQVQPKPVP
jgi:hypothetical protein